MTRIPIPPAALEAGARKLCDNDDFHVPWDDLDEYDHDFYRASARAAFEAMVAAWPGMWPDRFDKVDTICLPLEPLESSDE